MADHIKHIVNFV